ncbi:hypothetical protein ACFW04_003627 [Cataglyphis niger]
MRAFYMIVVLIILFASLASSWCFSIKPLMGLQDDTNSRSQILNFHENDRTTTPQVTMESRIIFIPRRNRVFCQPGEQVDRRGKCRMVW